MKKTTARKKASACDVRLEVRDAAGDQCDVQAVPVAVRHLSRPPRHLKPRCGAKLGPGPSSGALIVNALTNFPRDCTCAKCLRLLAKAIRRKARLRGEILPGEEDDYDNPYERIPSRDIDPLKPPERASLLAEASERLAEAVPTSYFVKPPRRSTSALPGSEGKREEMTVRRARRESLTDSSEPGLDTETGTGLEVRNGRNGTPEVLKIIAIRGEDAELDWQHWEAGLSRETLRERHPDLWNFISGESFLRRIETTIGRPLNAAARALCAWPWGWRTT